MNPRRSDAWYFIAGVISPFAMDQLVMFLLDATRPASVPARLE